MTDGNSDKTANEKLSTIVVDKLADVLAREYSNPTYRAWYCRTIYALGIDRVLEIQARVRDAKNPGMLFSKIASEAVRQKVSQERLAAIKDGVRYGR